MTKSFTQKKLEEFDKKWETLFCVKAFKKDKNYSIGDRNYLKTFLSESIEQAREEERERVKKIIQESYSPSIEAIEVKRELLSSL